MKILFVVERPTQFEVPLFRYAAADPDHDFAVLFTRPDPGAAVHDPELGRKVDWGFDLLGDYEHAAPGPSDGLGWVWREVRGRRPDLVIVNGYTQRLYLAAALAARRSGARVALRTDSVLFPGDPPPTAPKRLVYCRALGALFHRFYTTGSLGRHFLAASGLPDERVGFFPYPVDVARFGAPAHPDNERPPGGRTILALAKLGGREAPWDLVRAFASLADAGTDDLRLVIAGDGPERSALEREAERSAHGKVVFPGYVPYARLPELYAAADLFVHPAAEERWGVSVGEALAAGLPVVASSRVGAAHDLVRPGVNGERYPAGDPAALAVAIGRALTLDREAARRASRPLLLAWSPEAAWRGILEAARSPTTVRSRDIAN